jgi:transcriptional regulator with XRE-family HTH domain
MTKLAACRDLAYSYGVTLGERLRTARAKKDLTQHALAVVLGVSQNTIACWESDKTKPRSKRLRALAEALDLKPRDLLDGILQDPEAA